MTDPIRAKIIELVPEIAGRNTSVLIPEPFGGVINHRDSRITLADVLRAMPVGIYMKSLGEQVRLVYDEATDDETARIDPEYWDLTTDYDGQTQEVKEFIGKLLGVL